MILHAALPNPKLLASNQQGESRRDRITGGPAGQRRRSGNKFAGGVFGRGAGASKQKQPSFGDGAMTALESAADGEFSKSLGDGGFSWSQYRSQRLETQALTDKVESLHGLLKAAQTKLQAAEHAAQDRDEEVRMLRALLTKHEIPLPPRSGFYSSYGDSGQHRASVSGYAHATRQWPAKSGGTGASNAATPKNTVAMGVALAKPMSPSGNRSQDIRLRNSLVLKLQQGRQQQQRSNNAWPSSLKVPPHVQPAMRYMQPGAAGAMGVANGKLPANSPVRADAQQARVSGANGGERNSQVFRPDLRAGAGTAEIQDAAKNGASPPPPPTLVAGGGTSPRLRSPRSNKGKQLSPRKSFSASTDHTLLTEAKNHMKSPVLFGGRKR
jgi:hypothetical protein